MSVIEKFNSMSVSELENFGRDTQSTINDSTDELLKGFKCIDFGTYGKKVLELSAFANKSSNRLTAIAPIIKVNQLLGRYDNMENQLSNVEKAVTASKDRLGVAINISLDNINNLNKSIGRFDEQITELREYIEYIQELKEKDELDDDMKLQISANRLKVLTTFKVSSEHVRTETMLQIKMFKETASKMEDSIVDILPQFKLQLINSLGIKLHKDCMQILDGVYKMANDSVLESAHQIADLAVRTQENRQREIFKPETLLQANEIIQKALSQVVEDASHEAEVNIAIANRLEETSEQMKKVLKLGGNRKALGMKK